MGALSLFLLSALLIFPISSPSVTHTSPIISFTGKNLGFTIDSGGFLNISLGQGQEMIAEETLKKAARRGHRVLFQMTVQQPLWQTRDQPALWIPVTWGAPHCLRTQVLQTASSLHLPNSPPMDCTGTMGRSPAWLSLLSRSCSSELELLNIKRPLKMFSVFFSCYLLLQLYLLYFTD